MEKFQFEEMSLDALWALHEHISAVLSERIIAEKRELENRLVQLNKGKVIVPGSKSTDVERIHQKRKYPKVRPKYQNPSSPRETWTGRGKRPRWLVLALKAGGDIEDFRISEVIRDKVRVGH
jgi:DNA-binding protein H-NS